jgi:hypothetical protein
MVSPELRSSFIAATILVNGQIVALADLPDLPTKPLSTVFRRVVAVAWLGAAYPPIQSTTGRTFGEWLDTLNDEQKRLMEDGIAQMEHGELDD